MSSVVPEPKTRPGGSPDFRGEAGGQMRHHVHRIRGDDQHRVRSVLQHGGHDFAEHGGIALKQLEPRFARLLTDPGTQHHRPCTRRDRRKPRPALPVAWANGTAWRMSSASAAARASFLSTSTISRPTPRITRAYAAVDADHSASDNARPS